MEWSRMIAASMIATLYFPPASHADDAAARGAEIVDQWCRMCHLHGRDAAYFARFMQEDHFPMTTFRLFDHEKADVVAYLTALQRDGGTRR
ncbi:MAG: cytochrome c [Afipia sp.]|nr:cytochrome c [Afipia sp.]